MHSEIAPGVIQIDTLLGGWERVTAGYLVDGPAPVLVETGSQSSVDSLLAALRDLNIDPFDLAGIAVTHIHLDHAGGVGDVADAFPKAKVFVHERGARHLVDPTKLVNSASMVYGDLLDSLYGRLHPTPSERVHVLADGEDIVIGPDRVLTTVDSPGHAKHHLALHDSGSGLLFAGDAVGVRLPDAGILRPATPPPDFDLDQALESLRRFRDRSPSGIALAHFGLVPDAMETLAEADQILRRWAEVAEAAWRDDRDIAEALDAEFGHELQGVDADQREKLETLNGIHSNAAGFKRWLELREQGRRGDSAGSSFGSKAGAGTPRAPALLMATLTATPMGTATATGTAIRISTEEYGRGMLIGSHVGSADPLPTALAEDAECVQIFLGDPQSWKAPPPRPDADELRTSDIPVYVHAPYLINVASANNRVRIPSRKILQQTCDAAAEIGAAAVIVHGGYVADADDEIEGCLRWAKALEQLETDVPLFLENTAGGDHAMARYFEAIDRLWHHIGDHGVGFCLDTCHAHAAGESLVDAVDRIKAITGRIDLVHCNDSKDAAGSGRDRHEHLGRGKIGGELIVAVVKAADAPVICETADDARKDDLAWLRSQL